MKCPKCGTENENDAVFCKKCGEAIYEYWNWDEDVDDTSDVDNEETEEDSKASQTEKEPERVSEVVDETEDVLPTEQDIIENAENMEQIKIVPDKEEFITVNLNDPVSEIETDEKDYVFEEPEKRKSKIPLIIVECLILVGLLAWGYKMEKVRYAPNRVAEEYFRAELNSNFGEAYALTDFQNQPMLSGKYYADACALTKKKQGGQDLKVQKIGSGQTYKATYKTIKGDETYTETITLKKTGKKHRGLFDEWKVSGGDMLAENISFSVPKGSRVFISGREVPQEYIHEDDKSEMEEVIFPQMFTGSWQLRIEKEGMETFRKVVEVSDTGMAPDSFLLKPDEALGNAARQSAAADIDALIRYVYDKDGSVEGLFVNADAAKEGIATVESAIRGGMPGDIISVSTNNIVADTKGAANVVGVSGGVERSTMENGRYKETQGELSLEITFAGDAENLKIESIK